MIIVRVLEHVGDEKHVWQVNNVDTEVEWEGNSIEADQRMPRSYATGPGT